MTQQQLKWGHGAATWVATGFGVGRLPVAPGTFGTLVAIPLYLLAALLSVWFYAVFVSVLFLIGVSVCHAAERDLGRHDHPAIVWDEIVGFLITMFLAPTGWRWVVIGFLLFRLYDIWKPFPIRHAERLHGGLGCMADDALAGVYACVTLQAIVWLGSY